MVTLEMGESNVNLEYLYRLDGV